MKKIIKNAITFTAGWVGFIGGFIWFYQSNWQIEPLILVILSFLEIISYFVISLPQETEISASKNSLNNT